jgi:hypothetical protein
VLRSSEVAAAINCFQIVDREDVFLTVARNLSYQQDVSAVDIAVLVLVARGNTLDVLTPLVPLVLHALMNPERGAVTLIRLEGESQANTQK